VEFDDRPDHVHGAQTFRQGQCQVGGEDTRRETAGEFDADDARYPDHEGLPERCGGGLDAADAPPGDTERIDHRGVRVGADQRIQGRHAQAVGFGGGDHRRQDLEVQLVTDADPGRNDAEPGDALLGPAQEPVAVVVTHVLEVDVPARRGGVPVLVDLQRVVHDEIERQRRPEGGRVDAVALGPLEQGNDVRQHRNAGGVLEQDTSGEERHSGGLVPAGEGENVLGQRLGMSLIAQNPFDERLQRPGELADGSGAVGLGGGEAVVVQRGTGRVVERQRRQRPEGIGVGDAHRPFSSSASAPQARSGCPT